MTILYQPEYDVTRFVIRYVFRALIQNLSEPTFNSLYINFLQRECQVDI